MKILFVADTHYDLRSVREQIFKIHEEVISIDVISILGDVGEPEIKLLKQEFIEAKFIGVHGNHDSVGFLENHDILNVHNKVIKIGDISIAGLEGSYKYKNVNYPAFYQDEASEIMDYIPKADILISHNSPYNIHERNNDTHQGFTGINNYIVRNKPYYHFHGHQHKRITSNLFDTEIVGVFNFMILDTETMELINI